MNPKLTAASNKVLNNVLILGYDNDQYSGPNDGPFKTYNKLIPFFELPGNLVIGDRTSGVSLKEIEEQLNGKIDENTHIYIASHGDKNLDYYGLLEMHYLELGHSEIQITPTVLVALSRCSLSNGRIFVEFDVCYSGDINQYTQLLPEGAIVTTYARGDEPGTKRNMHHIANHIQESIDLGQSNIAERASPYQIFLNRMSEVSRIAYFCVSNGKERAPFIFTYDALDGRPTEGIEDIRKFNKYHAEKFIKEVKHRHPNIELVLPSEIAEQKAKETAEQQFRALSLGNSMYFEAFMRNPNNTWFLSSVINTNDDGTALHNAVQNNQETNVQLLVEAGANLELTYKGHTPLIDALRLEASYKIVATLVEAGANVNEEFISMGFSALHLATYLQKPKIVELLIKEGADPNARDLQGWTPLLRAILDEKISIIEPLLENNANPDLEFKEGPFFTPLHIAGRSGIYQDDGCLWLTNLLLKYHANFSIPNGDGDTPLHFTQIPKVANALIAAGADTHALNKKGLTPQILKHPETQKFLAEYEAEQLQNEHETYDSGISANHNQPLSGEESTEIDAGSHMLN